MSLTKRVKGFVKVILGLQYGDEGKGKIVDSTASKYDVIARFNGGNNAGHTIEENGNKHVLHLIPSGIFHEEIKNVIGNGVIVNPVAFDEETTYLLKQGINPKKNLHVSNRAKLMTWIHPFLDKAGEVRCGKDKIGTTGRGIGPGYKDARARTAPLVGNIFSADFEKRLEKFELEQMIELETYKQFGYEVSMEEMCVAKAQWFKSLEKMKEFNICDTSYLLRKELEKGSHILAEGAQSVMLDIHFGDYPNVTSSDTITSGVAVGLGVPISSIVSVGGVIKAYSTKVGGGKFIARMEDVTVKKAFQEEGNEKGSTTGRPRECGWLDLFALDYAIYLSDTTKVYMNKVDVCPAKRIKVITGYKGKDGKVMKSYPQDLNEVTSLVTKEFDGWGDKKFDPHDIKTFPVELLNYLNFVNNEISKFGARLAYIGTGPDRNDYVKW